MKRFLSQCCSVVALLVASDIAHAQSSRSVDFTLGLSSGTGGRHNYHDAAGVAAELTAAWWARPASNFTRTVAFTVGGQASPASSDVCVFETGPGSACAPKFPAIMHIGVLGGVTREAGIASLRLLAGPAFFASNGAPGAGGQLQVDAGIGTSHVSFVAVARGSMVVRFTNETLQLGSLGIGVRIH